MVTPKRRKSILMYLLLISATIIALLYGLVWVRVDGSSLLLQENGDELFCHAISSGESLPDISDNPPSMGKRKIFFLETSCNSYKMGKVFIKPRQACAVESAAKMNPNMDVYLLFASPGVMKLDESFESDRILRMLGTYSNIKILRFNVESYIEGSPVESLWKSGEIKKSIYPMAHTSDMLRLVTLWKFGGIYLDLDVIVTKSLEDLPENFAGAESDVVVANGVMGFSAQGKGHQYVDDCLNEAKLHFDGKEWSINGPKLITRSVLGHCSQFEPIILIRFGRCEEFRILPPSAFYLIPYPHWSWFFNENLTEIIESYVDEKSYLIHVWNKLSVDTLIPKTHVNVPYLHLASKYCPGVVQELDEYF